MSRSFKFRHTSEVAGGFVLLAVGLLIFGIYAAGHAQGWFQKRLILHATFPVSEGTFGLQEGAEVRILGTLAGRVGEIVPSPEGGMGATFIIKQKFRNFVRADSIGKVKKKFEVFGDAYVEITVGDPKQTMMRSGSTIKVVQDVELIQAARKMLDDTRAAVVPMLDEFRQILSHVNGITRQLEERQGALGRAIGDPEWAGEVGDIVKAVKATSAQLPALAAKLDTVAADFKKFSESLNGTADRFPGIADGVAGVVRDARQIGTNFVAVSGGLTGQVGNVEGVLLQTQDTLREIERLVLGLQNTWLLRKYIPPPQATEMISPAEVGAPKGGAQ
jgi:ABC-type transporter Mla subunit MlaD